MNKKERINFIDLMIYELNRFKKEYDWADIDTEKLIDVESIPKFHINYAIGFLSNLKLLDDNDQFNYYLDKHHKIIDFPDKPKDFS